MMTKDLQGAEVISRFLAKIDIAESGCWEWQACLAEGYGKFWNGEREVEAHRFSYELFIGTVIPAGMEIDHLCRNRKCVNPGHLEVVTRKINILRGESFTAVHARATHCPQGHPYNDENTYRLYGRRRCLICQKVHQKKWRTKYNLAHPEEKK